MNAGIHVKVESIDGNRGSAGSTTDSGILRERSIDNSRLKAMVSSWWPAAIVLLAFASTSFLIPTLAPIATTDDWGYSRSVELLHEQGRLTIFPVVAASAVFQVLWGFLFTSLFGMTIGIVRVSTLAMVGLGSIALFGLLRELGLPRGRSALGMATYLFNPVSFVLSYTFMTDPFLTSLLIIASFWYVKGLAPDVPRARYVLIGAACAGCAFLVRQQGALIPLGVVTYLILARRVRPDRRGVVLFSQVAVIPLLTAIGYVIWLRWFNDVPSVQEGFLNEIRDYGLSGAWQLTRNLTYIELMYLGFFALPLTISIVPALRSLLSRYRLVNWVVFVAATEALLIGLFIYGHQGKRFPYIPQFMGSGGLGPADVRGSRARIFEQPLFDYATVICALSAVILIVGLAHAIGQPQCVGRSGARLLAAIGIWQVIGILPPSFHYFRRGFSLDRYLLPLLPIVICLLLWSTRNVALVRPIGWLVIAVFAAFSVAATRDYLVYLDTVWRTAERAHAAGAAYEQIDAGAGWDGYRLYTYGVEQGITKARTQGGPWWMTFYGKASDSTYIVAGKPQKGYVTLERVPYSRWLSRSDGVVFLQSRYSPSGTLWLELD